MYFKNTLIMITLNYISFSDKSNNCTKRKSLNKNLLMILTTLKNK